MTFADELRSSKGPQIPQLTKEQKAARLNTAADMTITMLKEKARCVIHLRMSCVIPPGYKNLFVFMMLFYHSS